MGAFQNPVAFPPELTGRIREFHDVKFLLEGVMKQFPGNEERCTKMYIMGRFGQDLPRCRRG